MKKKQSKHSIVKIKHTTETVDGLYERIAILIRNARATVMRAVDTTMVKKSKKARQGLDMEENYLKLYQKN